jgi:hypothetical protein
MKQPITRKELIESDEYLEGMAEHWLHSGNETAKVNEIRDWIKEHRTEYTESLRTELSNAQAELEKVKAERDEAKQSKYTLIEARRRLKRGDDSSSVIGFITHWMEKDKTIHP